LDSDIKVKTWTESNIILQYPIAQWPKTKQITFNPENMNTNNCLTQKQERKFTPRTKDMEMCTAAQCQPKKEPEAVAVTLKVLQCETIIVHLKIASWAEECIIFKH
jgi:hypothetical protein